MKKAVDAINQSKEPFNQPGELFGSDTKRKKIRYVKALPPERPAAGSGPGNERPTVRRSFDGTGDDLGVIETRSVVSSEENQPAPIKRRALVGSFAAVRAARLVHQHTIDFWGDAGVIAHVVGQPKPDLSDNDASQMYQDFLLFSYLPKQMTPTRQEFINLVTPSKAVVNIQGRLSNMGIESPPRIADTETEDDSTTLTNDVPFAENLGLFCHSGTFADRPIVTR